MLDGPSYIPQNVKHAVILCHGYGSDGQDLMGLVPYLSQKLPDTAFYCPNAPTPIMYGGYEWFSLSDYTGLTDMISWDYLDCLIERAKEAARKLQSFVENIQTKHSLTGSDIVLGGFSQGGLVALYTGLTGNIDYAGLIGMSAVPLIFNKTLSLEQIKNHPPILLTHGSADNIIPVSGMNLNADELKKANLSVQTFISNGLMHGIDDNCLKNISLFLKGIFNNR